MEESVNNNRTWTSADRRHLPLREVSTSARHSGFCPGHTSPVRGINLMPAVVQSVAVTYVVFMEVAIELKSWI